MARFDTTGLDELIADMRRLGQDSGPVAEEMLEAAAEVVKESWKESARDHGHVDTGAMISSIDYPVKGNAGALYRDIYPQGKDAKGVSNAKKAFILHYGKSSKPGTYWVDDAEAKAAPKVIEVCKEIWSRFLESGG